MPKYFLLLLRKMVALPVFIVNYFVEFPSKVKSYENFGLRFTLKNTQIKPKVHAKVMSSPYFSLETCSLEYVFSRDKFRDEDSEHRSDARLSSLDADRAVPIFMS